MNAPLAFRPVNSTTATTTSRAEPSSAGAPGDWGGMRRAGAGVAGHVLRGPCNNLGLKIIWGGGGGEAGRCLTHRPRQASVPSTAAAARGASVLTSRVDSAPPVCDGR